MHTFLYSSYTHLCSCRRSRNSRQQLSDTTISLFTHWRCLAHLRLTLVARANEKTVCRVAFGRRPSLCYVYRLYVSIVASYFSHRRLQFAYMYDLVQCRGPHDAACKKTYVIGIWPGRQAWIVNRKAANCVRNSTITGTDIGNVNSHSSLTALTYIMAPIEVPVYCSSIQTNQFEKTK